ncbi:MAG TPA: hypothetical protein DC049_09650 [Spirochaetia bacterium]|nr:hypothetical protein [Spirochaetia bacterium]
MLICRVIGDIVATHKVSGLENFKFALLEELDDQLKPTGKKLVAADLMNSGIDEIVLCVQGSSARQNRETDKKPVDAVVAAIVDTVSARGKTVYKK